MAQAVAIAQAKLASVPMMTYSLARRSLASPGELVEAQDRLRRDQEADAVGLVGEQQHQDHQPLEPADELAALGQAGVGFGVERQLRPAISSRTA